MIPEQDFRNCLENLGFTVVESDVQPLQAHVEDLNAMIIYLDSRLTFIDEPSNVLRLEEFKPDAIRGDEA